MIDCGGAIQTMVSPVPLEKHTRLQLSMGRMVNDLIKGNMEVDMSWIGGHMDLEGGDLADAQARTAAGSAGSLGSDLHVSCSPSEAGHITNTCCLVQ